MSFTPSRTWLSTSALFSRNIQPALARPLPKTTRHGPFTRHVAILSAGAPLSLIPSAPFAVFPAYPPTQTAAIRYFITPGVSRFYRLNRRVSLFFCLHFFSLLVPFRYLFLYKLSAPFSLSPTTNRRCCGRAALRFTITFCGLQCRGLNFYGTVSDNRATRFMHRWDVILREEGGGG